MLPVQPGLSPYALKSVFVSVKPFVLMNAKLNRILAFVAPFASKMW